MNCTTPSYEAPYFYGAIRSPPFRLGALTYPRSRHSRQTLAMAALEPQLGPEPRASPLNQYEAERMERIEANRKRMGERVGAPRPRPGRPARSLSARYARRAPRSAGALAEQRVSGWRAIGLARGVDLRRRRRRCAGPRRGPSKALATRQTTTQPNPNPNLS